ncbi:peroxisomal membrane protein PMP34-like [Gigantopelta aegis]|uniref:peroxisomal membrane protein PMP34-like n=1 Tax=Gigantopelta aegis TaxID=1735272 RepID=UPI001B8880B6|nr:peroxisomal membrane protein PMP34-like [Gigantopelta aegis]
MTNLEHPVRILLKWCSSATQAHVKVELENGMKQTMSEPGVVSSLFLSYSNFVHALAGAVGSVVAITVFFPLDTARTRLQVDDNRKAKHSYELISDIAKEEGVVGLYRGLWPVVTSLWCSNFIYFYAFNGMKSAFLGRSGRSDPIKDLTLGFVAGVINTVLTTPLWVVNTRLRLQGAKLQTKDYKSNGLKYKGILDCLLKIAKHEGILALWSGTLPSTILASNPAIHFMIYEFMKRYFQKAYHTAELSGMLYFMIGAVAKAVATVVTYPLQVIQSRLRAGYSQVESTLSMLDAIMHLTKTHGVQFLYKGMEAKLLQTILTAALMFVAYEKIAAFIFHMLGEQLVIPKR